MSGRAVRGPPAYSVMNDLHNLTAGILAGGAGTRLRSAVPDLPKVLAPVAGRPFLTYPLDQLAAQGFRRVVLCTGYLGDVVKESLGTSYRGMRLLYSCDGRPLGTAGALLHALPLLASETVLVLNGDSFVEADLKASLQWHHRRQARATLLLAQTDNAARYGRVEVAEDGRIGAFCEKDGAAGPAWINSGHYWFQREALADLVQNEPRSLEHDVLPRWIGHGLCGYTATGRFLDIGVPEDYTRAEQFFQELTEPSLELAV
jgi:D-glycero-alpha-D-manno-heptose 1-phosphate guanylyltransferase